MRRLIPLTLIVALLAVLAGITPTARAQGAQPGVADVGGPTPSGPALESVHNDDALFAVMENGKTTIALRVCSPGPQFMLRSESLGNWITEIFYRTASANGCSPSPSSWWRMVYGIDPGPQRFRIYVAAYEQTLPEGEFMARARRYLCTVPAVGQLSCAREAVSAPQIVIDDPGDGATVSGSFTLRGWAVDKASGSGAGVTDVHVRVNGQWAGAAAYGESRPDVGSHLGDSRFTPSGYRLTIDSRAFADGAATIRVDYRSALTGAWHGVERRVIIRNVVPPSTGYLVGRVTNAQGGAGLGGARVSLAGVATTTDGSGNYRLPALTMGTYQLVVSRDGFQLVQAQVALGAGENRRDVALAPQAVSGLTLPVRNPVRNQAGDIVNAYYDLDRTAAKIYDHPRPPGTVVRIGNVNYTSPWPGSLWRIGLAYNGHDGVDFNGVLNQTEVIAAAPGYIVAAYDGDPNYNRSKGGNYVVMRHPDVKGRQVYTYYWHLQPGSIPAAIKYAVKKDILISRGSTLGRVGMSGNTTGPHLHFGVSTALWSGTFDPYAGGLWAGGAPALPPLAGEIAQAENQLPSASFNLSAPAVVPDGQITLNGSASADGDGSIVQHLWDMGDGTLLQGASMTHRFAAAGTYYVTLTTVDDWGAATVSDPQAVVVTSQAGSPGLDTAPPQGSASLDETYVKTAEVTLRLALAEGEPSATARMRFSSDGESYTAWEPFAAMRLWALTTDGPQAVYVQFADAAGNTSAPTIITVVRDTVAPIVVLDEPVADPSTAWIVSFPWDIEDTSALSHTALRSEYMLVGVDAD